MTLRVRSLLLGTVACAVLALSAPVAYGAFEVETLVANNCSVGHEACGEQAVGPYSFPKDPSVAEAEEQNFTQAGGYAPFGITHFKVATNGTLPNEVPTGFVTHIRSDVAPGLSTNPTALPQCTMAQFGVVEAVPGTGFYAEPKCEANTKMGLNKVVVYAGVAGDVPAHGNVYNLVQPEGLASDFGVALELPQPLTAAFLNKAFKEKPLGNPALEKELEEKQYFAHTFIEGHIEWGKEVNGTNAGDYHDYFEIKVSPTLPLISSRLVFYGRSGEGDFIVNPTACPNNNTTTLHLTDSEGVTAIKTYTAPVGLVGCNLVPFEPSFSLTPETTQSEQPDGIATSLTVPHNSSVEPDSSELKTATVTLPEGMTLNPPGAFGLEACTPAQARIHSSVAGVACPPSSKIGTATLNVPDLPPGAFEEGSLYLGGPESGPITDPPYTMYVDVESPRYGISVRLQGEVNPDKTTGRLTATFNDNPEQPFSNIVLHFRGGALAPIANPLVCGPAKTETSLVPYTATATKSPFSEFVVDSDNMSGACPSPLPFSLAQGAVAQPTTGGASTSFTFNLARADGQQYLSKVSAALPLGLVGRIPAVPLCPEPQASLGTCSSESQIGTATTTVGSGKAPIQFSGPVFLTGPTGGAPYGMTTVINAAVGPFSLGNVIVRSRIEVDPYTARVTVASDVPTIFKGIPLRMKTLSLAINAQGFLVNPTNCGALSTNTTLTSSFGVTQALSTPFQATNCSALAFKPKFGASSNAKTSRANGAALVTNINVPSGVQANFKSVLVTVPKQLPSRLSTLKNACLEAVFNANPSSCPANSRVGTARVKTPVLPAQLSGPAYFVSHGGAAFPDLDLVLSGNGVTVILVGNTNIKNGVTTTNFASTPDVPFTGFELNLPSGPNSAVTAVGNLCKQSLVMPTTITAQNGKVLKQNTVISVSSCPVTIISSHTKGNKAIVTVKAPEAGRVSGGGSNLKTVYKNPGKAQKVTLEIPLTSGRRPLAVRVRVGFIPKSKGRKDSVAHTTVLFK